jgi:hypothetical protein
MEGSLHIYTAAGQPATRYIDNSVDPPMQGGYAPDKMLFCERCDECWPASQMVVQCYYDGYRLWCAPGFGCKDQARMDAHAERTRARRSAGQRARHAEKKAAAREQGGQDGR